MSINGYKIKKKLNLLQYYYYWINVKMYKM